ncbi:MAG: M28 family metallopeptidase [Candidatus Helarchaeota archaeon]
MQDENQTKEYMKFIIEDICNSIGPRPPCSENEAKCANYIQTELKKYTMDSKIETFYCHPDAYRWQFRIPMINLILAIIFYWFYFFILNLAFLIISEFMTLFSIIVIHTNILRNIEFIDRFYKKRESTNVHGKFHPREETKRIIVIGGHHDAHWEFPILKKSPILFGAFMAIPIVFNHFLFGIFTLKIILYVFSFYFLLSSQVDLGFLIIFSIFIPILIYTAIKMVSHTPVLGADDNLSAVSTLMAVARHLKNTNELKNTEVWLVSHGCEEIGDRGSKRFSKTHYSELKNALVINLDMIGGKGNDLMIDIMEVMNVIKLSKDIGQELSKIAKNLKIPHRVGNTEAFTDSMAYVMNGIKACSILSLPSKGFSRHYHTINDTPEKIDYKNLWNCYKILITFIKKVDEGEIFSQ